MESGRLLVTKLEEKVLQKSKDTMKKWKNKTVRQMRTEKNGKGCMPILKTESQLKSFINRRTIKNDDEDFDWDDREVFAVNRIFVDGKKVIEDQMVYKNYGGSCHEFKRVIAIYLPRKKGSSQGSQP